VKVKFSVSVAGPGFWAKPGDEFDAKDVPDCEAFLEAGYCAPLAPAVRKAVKPRAKRTATKRAAKK
jgi:hypothetical protein